MATSFLPFLYPARLVQRPLRAPVVRQILRSLHATAPRPDARRQPPSSSSPSPRRAAPRRRDPIPFELPPDIERDLLPDAERHEGLGEEEDGEYYDDGSGHINIGVAGGAEGTITPLERQAFRRIFREISHRQRQDELDLDMYGYEGISEDVDADVDGEYVGEDGDDAIFLEALRQRDDAQRSRVNTIVGEASDAQVLAREHQRNLRRRSEGEATAAATETEGTNTSAETAGVSVLGSLGSLGSTSSETVPPPPPTDPNLDAKRNHVLAQFPPSLRSAAGKALGIKEGQRARGAVRQSQAQSETATSGETPATTTAPAPLSPAAAARRKRQEKMELAMLSKKTDFALWQYMEEHVFALVDEFGIGKDTKTTATAAKKGGRTKVSAKLTTNGPLYPALLLHGQRLLDSHFSGGTTSPLALAVLPRIKALGLASYVLGASTPLYNHLLGIRWLRQGDAGAVFALLSEMQRAGLAFDQGTLNLVKSIEWHVAPLAGGHMGLSAPSASTEGSTTDNSFLVAALRQLPDLAAVASTAAYWRQQVERSVNWGRGGRS